MCQPRFRLWLGAIAPSHYLILCWLIIDRVLCHSLKGNTTRNARESNHCNAFKNYTFKIKATSHRGQWVNWSLIPCCSLQKYIKAVQPNLGPKLPVSSIEEKNPEKPTPNGISDDPSSEPLVEKSQEECAVWVHYCYVFAVYVPSWPFPPPDAAVPPLGRPVVATPGLLRRSCKQGDRAVSTEALQAFTELSQNMVRKSMVSSNYHKTWFISRWVHQIIPKHV